MFRHVSCVMAYLYVKKGVSICYEFVQCPYGTFTEMETCGVNIRHNVSGVSGIKVLICCCILRLQEQ
jgi:hypothetical protein